MALTEQVVLDITSAQRQINDLERQLDQLSQPVEVPVNVGDIDQTPFRNIAESLGISEEQARAMTGEIREGIAVSSRLDADLRQVAQSLGLSDAEAAAFVRQMREAGVESSALAGSVRETSFASQNVAAAWARVRPLIAAAAAAIGGRAILGAGFDRFTTIEDATRALTVQLESADEAAEVLAGTLDVVRGTPFNLDQFAAATSQLIAFGVEAAEIPDILTAIGEASATRGQRAPEFVERLVQLFGQITTTGRISGEQITRFAETGVNALAILANSLGVTTDEVREMVSAGLIPAEQAIDAITTGIVEGTEGAAGATVALGGTMEGLRDTLSGAKGGLGAAVARFGETLVDAASPAILSWLQAATTGFDNLGGAIKGASDEATDAEASMLTLGNIFTDLPVGFGAVGDVVTGLGGAFVTLLESGGAIFSGQAAAGVDKFEEALGRLDDTTQNIAIRIVQQDVVEGLRNGVSEVDAFAGALLRLQDRGALTGDALRRMLTLTGVDQSEALQVLGAFRDADLPAEDIATITATMRDLLGVTGELAPDLDELVGGVSRFGEATGVAAPGFRSFTEALQEFEAPDFTAELEALEAQFNQLPDGLSAAAEALRDEEGKIEEDFSSFLANLEEQLATGAEFREGLLDLEALGLDDLAEVFREAGVDALPALRDALANPTEALVAEGLLEDDAAAIAQDFRESLASDILDAGPLALTLPVDIVGVLQGLQIVGLPGQDAASAIGARGVGPNVGGGVTINQNFENPPSPNADTERAAQQINALIGAPQVD